MTHYLRFPDEATGMAALAAAGFLTEDNEPITASHTHALDVIGPIFRGGTWDPETGEVITPPVLLNGWHVNYIGDLPDNWEQYVVTPAQPARVFAGGAGGYIPEPQPELVRARNELGQFIGDDPETPDINEAWVPATN